MAITTVTFRGSPIVSAFSSVPVARPSPFRPRSAAFDLGRPLSVIGRRLWVPAEHRLLDSHFNMGAVRSLANAIGRGRARLDRRRLKRVLGPANTLALSAFARFDAVANRSAGSRDPPAPSEETLREILVRRPSLRKKVRKLADLRRVAALRLRQGLSLREIAQQLGLSRGRVTYLWSSVRRSAGTCLLAQEATLVRELRQHKELEACLSAQGGNSDFRERTLRQNHRWVHEAGGLSEPCSFRAFYRAMRATGFRYRPIRYQQRSARPHSAQDLADFLRVYLHFALSPEESKSAGQTVYVTSSLYTMPQVVLTAHRIRKCCGAAGLPAQAVMAIRVFGSCGLVDARG